MIIICTITFFRFDIDPQNKEKFFTNSERSLIVKEILDRTQFSKTDKSKYGIHKLLDSNIFTAAYPLHEGPYIDKNGTDSFNGIDKDRQVMVEMCDKAIESDLKFYVYVYLDDIQII